MLLQLSNETSAEATRISKAHFLRAVDADTTAGDSSFLRAILRSHTESDVVISRDRATSCMNLEDEYLGVVVSDPGFQCTRDLHGRRKVRTIEQ